jgi:glycosyltransferase involved in cell wall biosynthesis
VDDVPAALARSHVLLHCADAEPYGLALVEALAAGRPVVAPAAGGPLEIVREGAGRLYRAGDADAGAAALRAVLADARAPARARRRAQLRFDLVDSTRRLEAAIDRAVAARR